MNGVEKRRKIVTIKFSKKVIRYKEFDRQQINLSTTYRRSDKWGAIKFKKKVFEGRVLLFLVSMVSLLFEYSQNSTI